ncbi:hypothetical protein X777_08868 [Ooceraea biroi]|uniref:Uncharacterized protein n=1 Tax=Ooceraea biroi TaxID=2015173 RepID=A0A026W9J1_OOCBI|nr:hypothetical protein X777_08868 [Ooceraea biroi]
MQHALEDTHFIDEWIASKDKSFLYRGIHLLPERWEEVVCSK